MEPSDQTPEQGKKIKYLEMELNDLRQGLAIIADYYQDLKDASGSRDATETVDSELLKPLIDDDLEFESIWRFHEDLLVPDPFARVPCETMYDAFVRYCERTGRTVVEQDAFEFVFAHMEKPRPGLESGEWTGYRLRSDTT
jgi:hypothetical protein